MAYTNASEQTSKLRVAIVGAGMMTRHHILAWNRLPQVEITAISARHLPNARKRADEFSLPAAYNDVAEMLDKEKPDVLDIAWCWAASTWAGSRPPRQPQSV